VAHARETFISQLEQETCTSEMFSCASMFLWQFFSLNKMQLYFTQSTCMLYDNSQELHQKSNQEIHKNLLYKFLQYVSPL